MTQRPQNANLIVYLFGATSFLALIAALTITILAPGASDATPTPTASIEPAPSVIDPPRPIDDFTFVSQSGQPLSLSDLRGQYVLIYFGYTRCPDACPATLLDFRRIQRGLGADAERMSFLMVSVDAQCDTPQQLSAYLSRYDPSFLGMSGTEPELSAVLAQFGAEYSRRPTLENEPCRDLVDHTASKFLVDPQGNLIRVYSFTATPEAILDDLQGLF